MDSKWAIMLIWVCLVLFCCISNVLGDDQYTKIFQVTKFGAIADGQTDGSKAFMNAWSNACQVNGGVVAVPKGTFLVKAVKLEGPCNGATYFRNKGTIIASSDYSTVEGYWILFYKIVGWTLFGNGTFDGNGQLAWSRFKNRKPSDPDNRPVSVKFEGVSNLVIKGIYSVNSKMFHLLIDNGNNVKVNNVHILAPEDSPNTDGIHIGNSNNVKVQNSYIATGDDCISLGVGNTNINISSIWCGPGHGISIGSLGRYTGEKAVSGIYVKNCTFTKTTNGLRIKTWANSSIPNTVSNVIYSDINVNNVQNPIIIDQFYCLNVTCDNQAQSAVQIDGVKFINVKGTSASKVSVNVQCSKSKPCRNIEFSGLNLKLEGTNQPSIASCSNAENKFIEANQIPSQCS